MNKEQIDLLGEYIKFGKAAILLEEIPQNIIEKGAVVIEANCTNKELTGSFENMEFKQPKWFTKLQEEAKNHTPVLIIKDINKVPEQEQRKFIELFKYKKAYVHKLPKNCVIFVTYDKENSTPVEKEVYSFMAQI